MDAEAHLQRPCTHASSDFFFFLSPLFLLVRHLALSACHGPTRFNSTSPACLLLNSVHVSGTGPNGAVPSVARRT